MASRRERARTRVDRDGVRVRRSGAPRRDVWVVVAAGALVVALLVWPRGREEGLEGAPARSPAARSVETPVASPADEAAASTVPTIVAASAADRGAPSAAAEERRRRVIARRIARKLPRTLGPEGKPELQAADAIAALRAAGVTDGIAAFPPPGTDPPKAGVIVPEGIELPEGYVRHHQTTDEGEALPPILLFHPDYDFFDEAGEPIDVPEDRVVPPDLVPPGIPLSAREPSDPGGS